ncbi:MAG: HD domain-containing protein [Rubrobacter sp.]|nr:HD domain-containing protein [Rubrobacter sp.]
MAAIVAAAIWLSGMEADLWAAYLASGLALVYGLVLSATPPGSLRDSPRAWLWRSVVDVALISVLIYATGGVSSPFFALYLLAALGAVEASDGADTKALAGILLAGYLSAAITGTGAFTNAVAAAGAVQTATLLLACHLASKAGLELGRLRGQSHQMTETLASEERYAERVSESLATLGPALALLRTQDTLQWAVEAAQRSVEASYAHIATLEDGLHRTVAGESLESYPSWWHPEIQRLVLWSARSGKTMYHHPDIPGMEALIALPVADEDGVHGHGALIVGGDGFAEEEERILRRIARETALALTSREEASAGRDSISRLPNHASLRRVLQKENTYNGAVTLLCAEIEGLERHSRLYGPAASESLLREIGDRLDASTYRAFQTAADEIAVLVSGNNESRVRRSALGLKSLIESLTAGSAAPFTVYVGITHIEDAAPYAPEESLREARRALTEARRNPEGVARAPQTESAKDDAGIILALVEAAEAHDAQLGEHLRSVSQLSRKLGAQIGLPEHRLQNLETAALLHDVGKIGLPQKLLRKPSSLTAEEYETMKQHPDLGVRILKPVEELKHTLPVIKHHHERYDGTGYPDGLSGENIPLEARITLVADALDVMMRDRVYQPGIPMETAVREITTASGTQFDPDIVDALLALLESDRRGLRLAT